MPPAVWRAWQVCDASLGHGDACWREYEIWLLVFFAFWVTYGAFVLIGFGQGRRPITFVHLYSRSTSDFSRRIFFF